MQCQIHPHHFKISYRYLPSKHATAEHIRTATSLFETIGLVSVVEEEDMHAVTALSGSGPAYIYYVVEAMEEAATKIGLKEDVAKSLILQTMIGAAEMLKVSDKHPSILRKEITSPGGTEAGIEVLQEHKFHSSTCFLYYTGNETIT